MAVFNSEPEVIAVGCMRLRIVFAALLYYRPSRRFADTAHRRTKPCTAPDGEQKTSQTRRKTGASVTIRSI